MPNNNRRKKKVKKEKRPTSQQPPAPVGLTQSYSSLEIINYKETFQAK